MLNNLIQFRATPPTAQEPRPSLHVREAIHTHANDMQIIALVKPVLALSIARFVKRLAEDLR